VGDWARRWALNPGPSATQERGIVGGGLKVHGLGQERGGSGYKIGGNHVEDVGGKRDRGWGRLEGGHRVERVKNRGNGNYCNEDVLQTVEKRGEGIRPTKAKLGRSTIPEGDD